MSWSSKESPATPMLLYVKFAMAMRSTPALGVPTKAIGVPASWTHSHSITDAERTRHG